MIADLTQTFRRIWPFIRVYKGNLLLVFLFGIIISLCNVALPILANAFLNSLKGQETVVVVRGLTLSIWQIPLVFPVLYGIWGVARYFHYAILIMVTEKVVAEVRRTVAARFLRLSLNFHGGFESGSGGLMSRVLNDTTVLQSGLNFFGDVLREPMIAIFLFSYMLWLDWKLTLGLISFLPIFVTITRQIGRSLRKYGHASREAMEEMTANLKENLDGVRVIQSFNLEDEMNRRLSKSVDTYIERRGKIVTREEAVSPVNEFLASLLVMGLLYYVIGEVFGQRLSPGDLIAFLVAAGQIQNPIKRLQESFVRVQQTIVVSDRLFSILESPDVVPISPEARPVPLNWESIEFRNVGFRYGTGSTGAEVLRNVNLSVRRGSVIAFVGTSGSGKSTLVNLLPRFFDPSSGEILIDGVNIREFGLADLRQKIALVSQDVFLFRDTVERNIRAGRPETLLEESERLRSRVIEMGVHAHADPFIRRLPHSYDTVLAERGLSLSGGEKQRLSIARAFFKDAPILILDEATSALDSVSEQEVQKGLAELMEGRTVFLIAHRLSTVRSADRIIVMRHGEIVEQGTHEELMSRGGEYRRFNDIQTGAEGLSEEAGSKARSLI